MGNTKNKLAGRQTIIMKKYVEVKEIIM